VAIESTPPAPGGTPVFLDASGRRHRAVRVAGWVLAGLMIGYLVMLGISLAASPGFLPLSVPGVKLLPNASAPAIPHGLPPGKPLTPLTRHRPQPSTSAGQSVTSSGTGTAGGGGAGASGHKKHHSSAGTSNPSGTSSTSPSRRPTTTPTPTRSPTRTPSPTPTPTQHPTRNTSPSPSRRPTSHPSPTSTHHTGKPTAHHTQTSRQNG